MIPRKITVALPAYGRKIDVSHAPMWIRFGMEMERRKKDFAFLDAAVMDECNLARVRNALVKHSLVASDWLLMLDADTTVENAESLVDMVFEGERLGAAAIAAPVRHRAVDAWNVQDDRWDAITPEEFRDRVIAVGSIGAACMAISVEWLLKHWPSENPDPWFQFRHLRDNMWKGEDLAFCEGVRRRGGQVLCDGRVRTVHRTHGEYLR